MSESKLRPAGKREIVKNYLPPDVFRTVVSNTPLVSIDIVALSNEGMLVGKRINKPCAGTYFVPGGRISKNERFDEAFRRISAGEIGIALDRSDCRFLGIFDHIYDDSAVDDNIGTHYVVLAFAADVDSADVDLQCFRDQHDDLMMMRLADAINNEEVHENTRVYARILMSEAGGGC